MSFQISFFHSLKGDPGLRGPQLSTPRGTAQVPGSGGSCCPDAPHVLHWAQWAGQVGLCSGCPGSGRLGRTCLPCSVGWDSVTGHGSWALLCSHPWSLLAGQASPGLGPQQTWAWRVAGGLPGPPPSPEYPAPCPAPQPLPLFLRLTPGASPRCCLQDGLFFILFGAKCIPGWSQAQTGSHLG